MPAARARTTRKYTVLNDFSQFGLAQPILQAVATEGYTTPTPIQVQAIPPLLTGRDLLGIAQTGTGKTAAFALPILHRLAADRRRTEPGTCRVLVLSPTRELASQIAQSFRDYGKHLGLRVAVVFGGVGARPQVQAMARGTDILVATPGRLLDHMGTRSVRLDRTEVLVLDEADRMLDLGFIQPIRRIV
ncbi:MAG: DEAD/DEAH box helicase, partial [Proteobacteria bacterium]|nr:DEAD/DEAH box helicase [Pseudomonadota bacterium]